MEKKKMSIEWRYFWSTFVGFSVWSLLSILAIGWDTDLFSLTLFGVALMALSFVALPIGLARRHIHKGGDDPVGLAGFTFIVAAGVALILPGNGLDWQTGITYGIHGVIAIIGANQVREETAEVRAKPVEEATNVQTLAETLLEAIEEPAEASFPSKIISEPLDAAPMIVADEEPAPKPNKKAIYALSIFCCVLLIPVITVLSIQNMNLRKQILQLSETQIKLNAEIAELTKEHETDTKELKRMRDYKKEQAYWQIKIEHVLGFYYDRAGLLDGDGKAYYHRFGCGCPFFEEQDSFYIYNLEAMPSRSKPCPYCYSRKADLPIVSVTYKY